MIFESDDRYANTVTQTSGAGLPSGESAHPPSPVLPHVEDLVEMHRRMLLIRRFEERVGELYRDGEIPGFVHLSIGQEASAVGACWPLEREDVITSTHRGHGHCIAKGMDVAPMLAELMGKVTGTNRGMGGSMHIADPSLGVYGANGIVAAGLPIAVGAAFANRLRKGRQVTVAFFGDGAVAQGAFHEAMNLAALWRLPVVFFCENNGYAEFSRAAEQHPVTLAQRATGYGIDFDQVDGNDVKAVAGLMRTVCDRLRRGQGPHVIEAMTYRWHGHYEGDPERYRTEEETESWRRHDPLVHSRANLTAAGIDSIEVEAIRSDVEQALDKATTAARSARESGWDVASSVLTTPREAVPSAVSRKADIANDDGDWVEGETFRAMDAVHDALDRELQDDERVFVAGVDVAAGGNIFGLTRGLASRWPGRLFDTPISETALMGLAVGAAMSGLRPVVELMYLDFVGVCMDQILNQAAKLRFMTGGAAEMGLTIRTQFGAGRSSGSQHSQSLEVLLAHIPGLKVVMPRTPADTYGLLRAAIQDPEPVIFIENRLLYGMKGPRPAANHVLPLGRAEIVRPGTDVTVVSWSRMCNESLAAAEEVAVEGIAAEVIDLRSIAPLDRATILASVQRTARLVIAQEAVTQFGVGAEVAAIVATDAFWSLDVPIIRVGARNSPAPYAPLAEREWLPGREQIADALRSIVRD
jgi:2-oxoisovalerate dehydrogenase E1 component